MEYINQVITGDCENVLKDCPDQFCQLIVTSPVYADISNKYKDGYKGVAPELYCDWILPKIIQFERILKNDGVFVLNIDSKVQNGWESVYVYELITRIVKETGFKLWDTLFWSKLKGLPLQNRFWNKVEFLFVFAKQKGFKFYIDEFRTEYSPVSLKRMDRPIKKRFARTKENQTENLYRDWKPHPKGSLPANLIEISSESKRICDDHVACFPISLPERFILGMTDKNDIVVDPFCGTGSTLVAAKKNGRNYLGIDISEDYVKFSKERLNNV